MTKPRASWAEEAEREPPRAEVTRVGRWTYRIVIVLGICCYGPYDGYGWTRIGRARAERKAEREMRRYLRDKAWRREVFEISASDLP